MKRSLTLVPPAFDSKVAIFSHLRIPYSHLHFVKKFFYKAGCNANDTFNFASHKLRNLLPNFYEKFFTVSDLI